MRIKRALISVSDKTGLKSLIKALSALDIEIISTGGTAKAIKEAGVNVRDVSDYTGFPEMMDGRVKTLHPKIHGGLLALRDNERHMRQAKENKIDMIDMVVVNLYPFEKTVSKKDVTLEEAVENIDIGGPSMIRSAAKNYRSVAVIADPKKYPEIIKELKENDGSLSDETLKGLACDVFKKTSRYENAIFRYMMNKFGMKAADEEEFPESINIMLSKKQDLRYGENPHQKAAFYRELTSGLSGVTNAKQLQGKELSFNNILDINAAIELVKEFDEPACCVIKHTNPCGCAAGEMHEPAFRDALNCDRLSAFGSIIGFNGPVHKHLADVLMKEAGFIECIVATAFHDKTLDVFSAKKNLRLLEVPDIMNTGASEMDYKRISGGFLVQNADIKNNGADIKIITKRQPTKEEMMSLIFAWKVVKHVKSNAIVLCEKTKTVGIGAGQMSRVDSVMIATRKAKGKSMSPVMASDAFFPMADSIMEAHKAGVKAIIQPGGSIRDKEVIDACDKYGIAMVFTGVRHFKH